MQKRGVNSRPWWWDGLASLAFFGQAIFIGKAMSRALGPIAGLFFFLFNFGLGYHFGRAAWRALLERRDGQR